MNLINPYQIMGIDPDKPDLKKLKKTYYRWALLCHPDKGGKKEDMTTIHNCYLWIKKQFKNCENQKTYEELESEFELFCKTQEENPPPFVEIWKSSDEYKKLQLFNSQFEKEFLIQSKNDTKYFTNGGYGNLMDQSEWTNNFEIVNEQPKTPRKKTKQTFHNEIIIYEEPTANPFGYGENYRFDVTKVNDYSHEQTYDYQKAFSNYKKPLVEQFEIPKRPTTLEELKKQRETFLSNYQEQINNKVKKIK